MTGENIYWSRQDDSTDPERWFRLHIQTNAPGANNALFLYIHVCMQCPLTKPAFLEHLRKVFVAGRIKPLPGYSICIGSTLEYLLRGILFDVVKVIGRWNSDAFILY